MKKLTALLLVAALSLTCLSGCAKSERKKINGYDDLETARIGILAGTTWEQHANTFFPNATILKYDSSTELNQAWENKKIDARFAEISTIGYSYIFDSSLAFIDVDVEPEDSGIIFNKEQAELCEKFNEFMAIIKEDGTLDGIMTRANDPDIDHIINIKNSGENGVIKLGVASDLPTSSYKINDIYAGFDIEIMENFGAYVGKKIEYQEYTFAGLITACVTGKVDAAAAGFSITEERKKEVLFGTPNNQNKVVVMIEK